MAIGAAVEAWNVAHTKHFDHYSDSSSEVPPVPKKAPKRKGQKDPAPPPPKGGSMKYEDLEKRVASLAARPQQPSSSSKPSASPHQLSPRTEAKKQKFDPSVDLEEDEDLRQEEQSRKRKFLEDMRTHAAASGFSSLEMEQIAAALEAARSRRQPKNT